MTRHLGKVASSEDEVVVHYMLIPEQTTNALVTRTGRLSGVLRHELLQALTSAEGQQAVTFADVVGRKRYADSGKPIFRVLHEMGLLETVPIDDIVMTPQGNHRIPLRTVLEAINAIPVDGSSAERFNPHTYNSENFTADESLGIAHNLLGQADMLEMDARGKREEAYRLAPALRPKQDPVEATVVEPTENGEPA